MEGHNILAATMRALKRLQDENEDGIQQALLLAACVEILEPEDQSVTKRHENMNATITTGSGLSVETDTDTVKKLAESLGAKEGNGETPEAEEVLSQIEGIETQLQQVEQTMARYKLSYKAAKETRDDLLGQMREAAKTRLEENPLFDGLQDDDDTGKRVIHTKDGRKITPKQMVKEITASFAAAHE